MGLTDLPPTVWGLFLACGAIVVAYVAWMRWVERR
jgi:hypothetical protein